MTTLRDERNRLADEVADTYDPDAFPGTPKWTANENAERALREFDREHPEIVEEVRAEFKARQAARYDALSDHAKAGS